MRTTILLDDELWERLREAAHVRGQSLSRFLADAGRAALKADQAPPAADFELVTYGGSGVMPGVDLDRCGELVAAEDAEAYER